MDANTMRAALHDEIQSIRDSVSVFGQDVFDTEAMEAIHHLTCALHDVIDGEKLITRCVNSALWPMSATRSEIKGLPVIDGDESLPF